MRVLLAVFSAACVLLGSVNAQVTISNLLVENKVAPLGIDVSPRFSWTLASSARSVAQSTYRITVSTKSAGASDVWDSGAVSSSKPYLAPYSGPALASDTSYFWSVSVTTSAGTGASASSTFSTGFLKGESDWAPSVWVGKNTTVVPAALLTTFTTASWIWAPEPGQTAPNAPPGDVALRLTYTPPAGKVPSTATIVLTADDRFTLYANGVLVGSSPNTTDIWKAAQIFRNVDLSSSKASTLFAIRATNLPDVGTGGAGPAAVLFSAQITFTDGSTAVVSSSGGAGWKAITAIPANFQLPTTSDASWSAPTVLGTYGVSPWLNQVVVANPVPSVPVLTASTWIWNSTTAAANAPPGPLAFRRTFTLAAGKEAVSAVAVLTADDFFSFWVQGALIGSAPNDPNEWQTAQQFNFALNSTNSATTITFAVLATNVADVNSAGDSPAGFIAAINVLYADGSSDTVLSDTAWKVFAGTLPTGWQNPGFNDAAWAAASGNGVYGVQPWGTGVSISDPLGEHPAPMVRGVFGVSKQVTRAYLYYAAGGYATIALNGKPVSDHVLTPGFTKYDTRMQYVVLDVTSLVAQGTNALTATLGRSHYGVTQGSVWNWNAAPWHGEPVLRTVLSMVFSDGTTQKVGSGAGWKVAEGPTRLDDIFGGENFDASYIVPGWELPGFDDSAWNDVLLAVAPKGALVRARQPPTRLIGSLTPVSITQPVAGQFVAAFERVVAGWGRITAQGPKGSLITVHYGEKLNPDGTVIYQDLQHYYSNNFQTDRFWLAGTGAPETFESQFSYKGYQYIQIFGWPSSTPPTPADIIGQIVHDDLTITGDFTSSDELLNQLHTASVFTMLNNVHSIPTDCPQFEKNGWSGDAMLATEMFLTNFDSSDLLAKYAQDLDDSLAGGPPAVIAPDSGWGANNQADPWHSALILIPAWIYSYRGDIRVLSDNYAGMKAYIEFELGRSPNDIANTGLGDWDTPETSPLGGNPPEDSHVPATAFLYHMLDTMATVATVLSNTADAATFTSQAAAVKNAFNAAFLNSTVGHYVGVGDDGYRQSHNLLALAFNLTPNATTAQVVADSVVTDVNARGVHLNTGALSTKQLLPMLTLHGHVDTALALAKQTTFPSWGFWIENGATTMWEHWLVTARSHDHMFLGTFEDWFYKYVLGIQSTSTAFQTVSIAPAFTSSLASASGYTLTPFGNLTVAWSNANGVVSLNLGVPVGVTANVSFTTGTTLQEGGKPVAVSGQPMSVTVGSGKYSFVAK
ncbi:bacterial alpha-L-rhamnosidase-domain-containing protein [Mycena alexandri]|uniref:alpha-L-rhamnosidase n=1 Tax=Mycena alexandri TaxID=1745969 RepID=A0AAD6TDR1_9AGAR|nr:bacterial alpha-L-rhamnosidase-domain-containing protein [Mycena alexandri]